MRNCDVARMESRGEGRKCGLSTLEKNFPKTVEKNLNVGRGSGSGTVSDQEVAAVASGPLAHPTQIVQPTSRTTSWVSEI